MIRGASRLLLVLLCACLACEDEDDFRLEDRPSELEVCFAATLDILPESVASTNTTPSTRRHYDREPLCWTWRESRDIANDRIDFTLTRVFSIGDDGTRYGCRFAGSGNSLQAARARVRRHVWAQLTAAGGVPASKVAGTDLGSTDGTGGAAGRTAGIMGLGETGIREAGAGEAGVGVP